VVQSFTSTIPVHIVGVLRKRVDVLGTVDLPAHSCKKKKKSGLRFSFRLQLPTAVLIYVTTLLLDFQIKHEDIWT